MSKKSKVTKNSTLAEILKKPKGEKILAKHKVPCLSCPFSKLEMEKLKIGEIGEMYGIDVKGLLKDLNS